MDDSLCSARPIQRMQISGVVLMDGALKIVDRFGAELILPLPLNIRLGRLTDTNIRFQDIELVKAEKGHERNSMEDFPGYLESGHYSRAN